MKHPDQLSTIEYEAGQEPLREEAMFAVEAAATIAMQSGVAEANRFFAARDGYMQEKGFTSASVISACSRDDGILLAMTPERILIHNPNYPNAYEGYIVDDEVREDRRGSIRGSINPFERTILFGAGKVQSCYLDEFPTLAQLSGDMHGITQTALAADIKRLDGYRFGIKITTEKIELLTGEDQTTVLRPSHNVEQLLNGAEDLDVAELDYEAAVKCMREVAAIVGIGGWNQQYQAA